MNNSEGLRCLNLAEKALSDGNFLAAERLSLKAMRMLSEEDSAEARFRLNSVYKESIRRKQESTSSDVTNKTATTTSAQTSNKNSFLSHSPEGSGKKSQAGSNEQTRHSEASYASYVSDDLESKCQAIVMSKDYYQILGIPRHADNEDIKKAYRKLALQLHPDKAKCPSAEAAFKIVAKAYQCLSDPEARKHFDTYGTDRDVPHQASAQDENVYSQNFMSAEELFASFFGVQFLRNDPRIRTRVYRVHQPQSQASSTHSRVDTQQFYGLLQIFPLVIIIAMSLFSNLFSSSNAPPFSLSRSPEYHIARATHSYQLPYYVKSNFHRSFPENSELLYDLEDQIELNYFLSECNREKQPILQQLQRLQFYGTSSQYNRKAEELRRKDESSSNCRNYRKIKENYNYRSRKVSHI